VFVVREAVMQQNSVIMLNQHESSAKTDGYRDHRQKSFIHFFEINSDKTHCRYRDRTINSLHSEMLKSQIKMKVQ